MMHYMCNLCMSVRVSGPSIYHSYHYLRRLLVKWEGTTLDFMNLRIVSIMKNLLVGLILIARAARLLVT